jgi:acyl-CoA reductase-like NAD-dependent aldehyde dehydrogenase
LKKPVTAELGSVNPYIVAPGNWTPAQITAHAEQLVCSKMLNNGHICASPQVVVTCKNWPQRDAFLAEVRRMLQTYPGTRAYYPACDRSYKEQLDRLKQAVGDDEKNLVLHNPELFPNQQQGPIFATGVQPDAFVLQKEAFCPVLAEVPLDTAPNAADFLPAAVDFANKKIWGSLTCTLICDTQSMQTHSAALEKALDDLQFGSVSLNQFAAFTVLFAQLAWGAYPRHNIYDIQSGTGKLGNSCCVNNVVKCVTRAPFLWPSIAKIKRNGPAAVLEGQRVTDYLVHQNFYRLAKLLSFIITGF